MNNDLEFLRPLTTAELLAEVENLSLEDIQEVQAVYIPPSVDDVTDEEDFDVDAVEADDNLADIAGTFELHTKQVDEVSEEGFTQSSTSKENRQDKRKKPNPPKWKKMHPVYKSVPNDALIGKVEDIVATLEGKSSYDVFMLYFCDDVLNEIIDFSKKYDHDNNRHSFELDASTMKRFLGILIFTGYHTLPSTKLYWSKDEDKGIPLIRNCMSRNRFMSVKQNLHLSNNDQLNKQDRFAKLRPIFYKINEKNMQLGIFSRNLSIDEEMVPYYGRHSCKMFIRGKPIRFGFKLWCLCSSEGYLYKFIPYGGASAEKRELGLGEQVVIDLLSVVSNPSDHRIYFDNFFTSHKLLCLLGQKGFFATGTVRENRTSNNTLVSCKDSKKRERGSYDHCFDESNEILLVRWNDNSVVTVASNNGTIKPLVSAKRYSRKEKRTMSVPQPNVINDYNLHMGGVDLHDNGIANYRIQVRGKKWWWPLFINLVDSVIVNSWRVYNIANNEKMTQFQFRSYLAVSLIKSEDAGDVTDHTLVETSECRNSNLGRPSKTAFLPEIQFDKLGHVVVEQEDKARRRCRQCKSTTIYMCKKCNCHLHPRCFEAFHTK